MMSDCTLRPTVLDDQLVMRKHTRGNLRLATSVSPASGEHTTVARGRKSLLCYEDGVGTFWRPGSYGRARHRPSMIPTAPVRGEMGGL